MGVYDAMNNAVGGLQAQSYALQNISGNIANSQTNGYKSVNTAFQDLLTTAGFTAGTQNSGSVLARSTSTITTQGTITASSVSTNLAIAGDGYFQVQAKAGESDNKTILTGSNIYTRQGDFAMSSEGYLVNSAGYFLTGVPVDPTTGNVTGSDSQPIKIDTGLIPAKQSTTINYTANLPSSTEVATLKATDLTNSSGYPATVAAADNDTFLSETLSGGSVTCYDNQGNEVNVQLRWGRTASNTWSCFYQSASTATGTATQWTNLGSTFTFNSTGKLTSPTNGNVTISNLTVDGTNIGNIKFAYDTHLTQYNSGTSVTQNDVQQNGYASGKFTTVAVSDGVVTATYTNGKKIDLYKVGVYTFDGDADLLAVSGNAYQSTKASGNPILNFETSIKGSSLENSNVDITDQFSKMIVTQQAYSANSKVISTANSMMQDVLDIIR